MSSDKLFARPVAPLAKYRLVCEACRGPLPVAHVRATEAVGTPIRLCQVCVLELVTKLMTTLEADALDQGPDLPWDPVLSFKSRVDTAIERITSRSVTALADLYRVSRKDARDPSSELFDRISYIVRSAIDDLVHGHR